MERFVLVAILCVFHGVARANMFLNGGGSYTLDYPYSGDAVFVDYLRPNDYTHLDILSGANTKRVNGYYNSSINFSGGIVTELYAYNDCQVNVTGGSTSSLYLEDNSSLNMSGGWHRVVAHGNNSVVIDDGYLYQACYAGGTSTMDITGGYIIDNIAADGYATITIFGSNFNYGYGTVPVGNPIKWSQYSGNITRYIGGTNYVSFNYYVFGNSSIILAPTPEPEIIPLPSAILLGSIGVGFVTWLRRRRML